MRKRHEHPERVEQVPAERHVLDKPVVGGRIGVPNPGLPRKPIDNIIGRQYNAEIIQHPLANFFDVLAHFQISVYRDHLFRGGQRYRLSPEGPANRDRSLSHGVPFAQHRRNGPPVPQRFPEHGQVRLEAVPRLGSAQVAPEARDRLIQDEQRPILVGETLDGFEEAVRRRIVQHGFHHDARDARV